MYQTIRWQVHLIIKIWITRLFWKLVKKRCLIRLSLVPRLYTILEWIILYQDYVSSLTIDFITRSCDFVIINLSYKLILI